MLEKNKNRIAANVHMLPTEPKKATELFKLGNGKIGFPPMSKDHEDKTLVYQHLYFTTDEEIKEGDIVLNTKYPRYDPIKENCKEDVKYGKADFTAKILNEKDSPWRKIIATTNPELWKSQKKRSKTWTELVWKEELARSQSYVARIDTDFIKAFVKAEGKIDKVWLGTERMIVHHDNDQGSFYGDSLKLKKDGSVIVQKYADNEAIVDAPWKDGRIIFENLSRDQALILNELFDIYQTQHIRRSTTQQERVFTHSEVKQIIENYDRQFKLDSFAYTNHVNYTPSEWFDKTYPQ